ncbi:uncharacterized protein LOC144666668 [Oculina patagonica]
MKLKRIFSILVAITSFIIVGIIVYMSQGVKETAQETISLSPEWIKDHQSVNSSAEFKAQQSHEMPTRKPFIYLTQTEHCLPPNLATSSQIGDPETCNCDVIVLSYRVKCQENKRSHISYLFDPNTLFASGRNVLFFAAMDRRPGYHYYIFLDDDTTLKYNNFTPANMTKMSPFRAVEKWLLDYEPAVGVLDYAIHHGASVMLKNRRYFCGINETSLVLPTVFFDAIFNAYHHKAIEHILPYTTQYERQCIVASNRNAMIAVEVKFGGQALLFAPVTVNNRKHRRKHQNCKRLIFPITRQFVQKIKQEAPPKLRNHVIFKMLHENPDLYLVRHGPTEFSKSRSQSFCVNVTRRQPIIPYRRLLNMVQI